MMKFEKVLMRGGSGWICTLDLRAMSPTHLQTEFESNLVTQSFWFGNFYNEKPLKTV